MKKQKSIMSMPVIIDVVDANVKEEDISEVFSFLHHIDDKFSTFKAESEINQINNGLKQQSNEMQEVLSLCKNYHKLTNGYFDISIDGKLDPSGLVKGYAIYKGAEILKKRGYRNFYLEIAGDIQTFGKNHDGKKWNIGIQNPFNLDQIVKVINISDMGIATSGNYQKGEHIHNPIKNSMANEIASITVIAKDILYADVLATACFAMGEEGINFLKNLRDVEGYMIKNDKTAIFTNGFEKYTIN